MELEFVVPHAVGLKELPTSAVVDDWRSLVRESLTTPLRMVHYFLHQAAMSKVQQIQYAVSICSHSSSSRDVYNLRADLEHSTERV